MSSTSGVLFMIEAFIFLVIVLLAALIGATFGFITSFGLAGPEAREAEREGAMATGQEQPEQRVVAPAP